MFGRTVERAWEEERDVGILLDVRGKKDDGLRRKTSV